MATESSVAVEESHRENAPSTRASAKKNRTYKQTKTCNQKKHKYNLRHACMKNTTNHLPSDSSRSTYRESSPLPSTRHTEREIISDFLLDDSHLRRRIVSSRSHEEREIRRFVYQPRRETILFPRRPTERWIIAVSSRNRGERENHLL